MTIPPVVQDGSKGFRDDHIAVSLTTVIAALVAIVRLTSIILGGVTAWKTANHVRTSVGVVVIGGVPVASVFVVIAASTRSVDDDITVSAALVVSTVVVIIVVAGDHFRPVSTGKSGDCVTRLIDSFGGCGGNCSLVGTDT